MGLGYYFLGGNVILSLKQLERTPLGSEKKKYKQKQKKKRLHCVIGSRFRTLASLHRWSFQIDWKRALQYVLYRFALVFSSLLTLKYKFWKQTIYALGKRERKGKRRREETEDLRTDSCLYGEVDPQEGWWETNYLVQYLMYCKWTLRGGSHSTEIFHLKSISPLRNTVRFLPSVHTPKHKTWWSFFPFAQLWFVIIQPHFFSLNKLALHH